MASIGRRTAIGAAAIGMGASLAAGAAGAAAADPAKIDYRDTFTTQQPGSSSARLFDVAFADPDDPNAKPPVVSHVHAVLPEGARYDTTAVPRCTASDAEMMLQGTDACPAETRVGTVDFLVDSGAPPPTPDSERFTPVDITLFNAKDHAILLSRDSASGAYVVVRAPIDGGTLDIDVPPLPGTPPYGGADKREHAIVLARTGTQNGRRLSYITTPPTCPASGKWEFHIDYTFRDGRKQTVRDQTPCLPAAPARAALRLAMFRRQRGSAGQPLRIRVSSSRAAAGRATVMRGGRRVLRRKVVLHTGVNTLRLPALARGAYRLELSARVPGGETATRGAKVLVR
ncbi:MAG TPA: hypothetical protein VF545_06605 [Thermoleophilaceae bacterium]|jgi:hypothetical protein